MSIDLTVAYIGFGLSVCEYHLPYAETRDFIHVKYIYRREEDRVNDTDRETWYPNIKFTSDIDEVMKDPEVNLIVVNTPDKFHTYYTRMALENGKNVLCEKPFAESPEEAKETFELAKKKGLLAMPNQNRRFDADMRTVRKVLKSGKLGELVEVESHYDYFRPTKEKEIIGFHFLKGLGVHPLDQMVGEFGIPKRIVYDVRSFSNPGKADNYYDIDLFYDRFKAIVKTSMYVKLNYPRFIVHGTKGSFLMPSLGHNSDKKKVPGAIHLSKVEYPEELYGTLSYITDDGQDITEKVEIEQCDYAMIYDNIYDVINNNSDKIIKDEEVICVLQMIEDGDKVAKEAK